MHRKEALLILTHQRRALEELCPSDDRLRSFKIHPVQHASRRYVVKGDGGSMELYLLGVSTGVGSCADLKDVDIAVFSFEPSEEGDEPDMSPFGHLCQWGVVLLEPRGDSDGCLRVTARGLFVESINEKTVVFSFSRCSTRYVQTIT